VSGLDRTKVRLFFAAVPDAATRERIADVAASLPLESEPRLVPRSNYHITLAFVGEVPMPQIHRLQQIGGAQRASAFALRFEAYEYWPKPELVVAAARTIPPPMEQLWHQLHRDLAEHRWALDAKRLRPHVTLARKVPQAPVLQAMCSFDWLVRDFCLMRSDTSGLQPAYTVVDTWPLLDNSAKA
jgi:2'-5' RNA ligase